MSAGKPNVLHLTRKEKALLLYLRRHAGKSLPRDLLLREVWGYRSGVKSRTLDVHVQRLRRKLPPEDGARILTVFRTGYAWSTTDSDGTSFEERRPQAPS